ncbi:OmpA family protein [Granulicella arctica]|uniref:OmpA family protein n=1 Tax=Granulicella arctica TaxID=940613 RepID=UPI0021DF617B|nr:OmpA family protein [Granulicella arctica]
MKDMNPVRSVIDLKFFALQSAVLGTAAVFLLGGCSSKNYVRSQTTPIIQQTNELDAKTASDHRTIVDTDERATKGIAGAMDAAGTADQHAGAAGQQADVAGKSAQNAVNRVDSLSGIIANLDTYKPLADLSVTFGFDKAVLTADDKKQLDSFASTLATARGYILQVTGGTDATGDAQYNYQLSQRRADAVVNYLAGKHNIPPHKFYLVGIGKDIPVASDRTASGRAKNRRVEIKLMSNMSSSNASVTGPSGQ